MNNVLLFHQKQNLTRIFRHFLKPWLSGVSQAAHDADDNIKFALGVHSSGLKSYTYVVHS